MFLNLLNEREAKSFIELAHQAMEANGVIKESEEAVVETFRRETGLLDYELKEKSIADLITTFQASTKKVKRAVIIELIGVLDADDVIDEKETKWITTLGNKLGFRDAEIRKMIRWVEDFNDLLQEGYDYIHK